jgi:hypothetical protein
MQSFYLQTASRLDHSTCSAGCLSHRQMNRAASPSGTLIKENMYALNVIFAAALSNHAFIIFWRTN